MRSYKTALCSLVFDQKKIHYWSQRTADDISPTCNDADDFLRFSEEKVKAVRAATEMVVSRYSSRHVPCGCITVDIDAVQ